MSKVTASTDMDNLDQKDLPRFLDICLQDIVDKVNGKLDFATNFNAAEVTVTFGAAATDTAVVHSLGRVASRYIVTSSTVALVVYTGATTGTSSTIYLRSSAIGAATILVY